MAEHDGKAGGTLARKTPALSASNDRQADLLARARRILLISWILAAAAMLWLIGDVQLRRPLENSGTDRLVRALALNNLALVPSGRSQRHPGGLLSSVDLRFHYGLPIGEGDPTGLLIASPTPARTEF